MPASDPAQGLPRPWFLYVLRCADGALYTGVSTDVARRYRQHQAGKGARYTRLNPPVAVALIVEYPGRSAALQAEHAFKQLSAAAKRDFLGRHGDAAVPA
ncbi:GIY-YIG nuclease family protein [Chromobacterium sp. ATCC 53434]|uniref:GIY-YIG nuclease family protein n=1 Tax=Chromobacterium sp. (strain ATCC 53434 / SC 14030) TaxID=2059672 RepID=UPI000C780A80|nr:GIY-YIG nuclease family protein [Chromobacterium sp. ATCC 53434]AUH52890.1 GIY-YIG nuclease family protein [Chromobacterium sp. ATCC 53434]